VKSFTPEEEVYVRALSGVARRLTPVPDVVLEPKAHYDIGWSYDKLPFAVAQYKLAAGAAIPYHDHRDYNGVLSRGECQYRRVSSGTGFIAPS
jgi:hypothetical protein